MSKSILNTYKACLSLPLCLCLCVCVTCSSGRGYLGRPHASSPAQEHPSTPSSTAAHKPGSTLQPSPDCSAASVVRTPRPRPTSVCCSSCLFLVNLSQFWFSVCSGTNLRASSHFLLENRSPFAFLVISTTT